MEFNDIYLLKGIFNYFNRKIYFYESLVDYIDLAKAYEKKEDINFNPNEGVNTSLVVSLTSGANYFEYCYLLVTDKKGNIISRWYIKDAARNLSGQFTLTLRRDVVAESLASTTFQTNAPIYVEKGHLDESNPLILNSEGMIFNQIKKSEALLQDRSKSGWIIGYFENGKGTGEVSTSPTNPPVNYVTLSDIATATGILETDLSDMLTNGKNFAIGDLSFVFGTLYRRAFILYPKKQSITFSTSFLLKNIALAESVFRWDHALGETTLELGTSETMNIAHALRDNSASSITNLRTIIQNLYPTETYYTEENLTRLKAFEGKTVLIGGIYYTLHIQQTGGTTKHPEIVIHEGENTYFDNVINNAGFDTVYEDWEIYVNYEYLSISLSRTRIPLDAVKASIPTSHAVLKDAPYSIFAIPYTDADLEFFYSGGHDFVIKKEQALDLATQLAINLGASLYDLQLLPYLPELEKFFDPDQDNIDLRGADITTNVDFSLITNLDGSITKGIILYPKVSKFSFTISKQLSINTSIKIDSQCDFYRLCSPNYNGVFEFNLAKNGGSVSYFEVDCYYKPYSPFIRLTPEFKLLYGSNFKDGRGLICGGDFSLTLIKNEWITYQMQNKNFEALFARDIENLEFIQGQERITEKFNIIGGTVGAGAAGAVAGSKAGPYGAIAGAAGGLAAGAAGGLIDLAMSEARRAEAKDYAIDRFRMSLGNIKALPQSLTKVSSFSATNKIFPFIEYYSCTEEEKQALENKIIYDGMTVGKISTISEFMGGNENQQYFKGQLIRALGIFDNEDYIEALYNELAKGVYI